MWFQLLFKTVIRTVSFSIFGEKVGFSHELLIGVERETLCIQVWGSEMIVLQS